MCIVSCMPRTRPATGVQPLSLHRPNGSFGFPRQEELANHNKETTALTGKNGFDTLEDRRALEKMFTDRAVPFKPRTAVRAHALSKGVEVDGALDRKCLTKSQDLNRHALRTSVTSDADLGDLMQATALHCAKPSAKHKGYFCVREIQKVNVNAHVTLVATTPALLQRWTLSSVSCVDGCRKVNIMKYPVHVMGILNRTSSIGVTALGVTSTMQAPHVHEMVHMYRQQLQMENYGHKTKWCMSDAESAYRNAFKTCFGAGNHMCYFHVVDASRGWLRKHIAFNDEDYKTLWTSVVKPDLELLHVSLRPQVFETVAATLKERWRAIGLATATRWGDPTGKTNDINTYLDWWLHNAPEVHAGHGVVLPTTNNACESTIRYLREDAGSVPNSMRQFVTFLLTQIEYYSKLGFDDPHPKAPAKDDWRKALAFRTMFGSGRIQEIPGTDCTYHVCLARADSIDSDVTNRNDISQEEASKAVALWLALNAADGSKSVNYEDLLFWRTVRVFFFTEEFGTECSRLAFPARRRCFHQLALDLRSGRAKVPNDVDFTPLAQKAKGRKAKAGDRYSVDEKVRHVLGQLVTQAPRTQTRRAKRGGDGDAGPAAKWQRKATATLPCAASLPDADSHENQPGPLPTRRLRSKIQMRVVA